MIVCKFGGTSVQNCEAIERLVEIIRQRLEEKPVIVVSALSKVTDLLYRICDAAAAKDTACCNDLVEDLRQQHLGLARELLSGSGLLEGALSRVQDICDALVTFVGAVCIVGDLSPRSRARILSRGELLSSTLIAYALNARGIQTNLMDARNLIITDDDFLKGEPDKEAICAQAPGRIEAAFKGMDAVITQGFVGGTAAGETTVLGRGGSDYSASLIGMAVGARRVEIWTDVDGVLTADPRVVEHPVPLAEISFEEAAEMAHFGAKVLHPMTIEPAVGQNIPILVLNSRNSAAPGTAILCSDRIEDGVKAVSSKEDILVINIFSTKMINTSGFLERVFGVFSDNKVPVDLVSTSEANISVTVDASVDVERVTARLSSFAHVSVDRGKSQVSVIGKNILTDAGIFRQVFSALEGRRIYMISQGATFINISFVVDREACRDAVRAIHQSLFEP